MAVVKASSLLVLRGVALIKTAGGAMEKFFLKRVKFAIEIWQIGLLVIVAVLGLIGYGAVVELAATNSSVRGIPKLVLSLARLPAQSKNVVKWIMSDYRPTLASVQRFEGQSGFERLAAGEDEAMLLARIDGDKNRAVVEIMDLNDGNILHVYEPDISQLNALSKQEPPLQNLAADKAEHLYTIAHPVLMDDGGIIFHGDHTPLAKIDLCSNVEWIVDQSFHHSIERDDDGNLWGASYIFPAKLPLMPADGNDDSIVKLSPDGEILFEKSVGEILLENDLQHLLFNTMAPGDPTHINDIEPVMSDGIHWRRGDVFLSLRSSSMILLYRPSTNKVLWHKRGPWMLQHDVDVLNDHQIAVFNNNAAVAPWGLSVIGVSDTLVYDFESDEVTSPFATGFEKNDVRTHTEGRSQIQPEGEIFVEEQNYGRILKMNQAGDVLWRYVNRAKRDGRVYIVKWVRYLEKKKALEAAAMAREKCGVQPLRAANEKYEG